MIDHQPYLNGTTRTRKTLPFAAPWPILGLIIFAFALCTAPNAQGASRFGPPGPLPLTPGAPLPVAHRQWIDSTIATMSRRERIAQMMMVWVLGDYTNARDTGFAKVADLVSRERIGGLVMSLGSPLEVADKINALQALARTPLLVASDVEPGLGRLEGGQFVGSSMSAGSATVLPSNMAIGATGEVDDAEMMGMITALESKAIGIHMAFAPVVDVNNNPANPVINTRSFGEDPARVAEFSAAFIRGLQNHGVAATAKHFPGHGDTDTDSHIGLPIITAQRSRLDSVELVPFIAAVKAGVAGIMTAHIALPNAYGDKTPATLSAHIMQGLLRDTLGFQGVTVTDAMTMEGITTGYGVAESTVQAVEAGDDIVLMPPDITTAIDALLAAVEGGRISDVRIEASVRRILELKLRTCAVARPQVSYQELRNVVNAPEHQLAAQQVASRAITLLRDRSKRVPIAAARSLFVITIAPDNDLQAGTWFTSEIRAHHSRMRSTRLSPKAATVTLDSLRRVAGKSDRIVVYTYTRTLEGKGRLALPKPIATFISRLAATGKLTVVAGGNPYQISQLPTVQTYLVTYGRGEALERAAARAFVGRSAITAHTPVSLPGFFTNGDGLQRTQTP